MESGLHESDNASSSPVSGHGLKRISQLGNVCEEQDESLIESLSPTGSGSGPCLSQQYILPQPHKLQEILWVDVFWAQSSESDRNLLHLESWEFKIRVMVPNQSQK